MNILGLGTTSLEIFVEQFGNVSREEESSVNSLDVQTAGKHGYAPVNGLKMYYEIEGSGDPLVCIPPAFGYAGVKSYPALVQSHAVITVDLQGHGRTEDIPERPLSIEQYADDVVGLLKYLGIAKADFFGESYGGNTVAMIAIRYRVSRSCGDFRSNIWPS